MSRRPPSTYLTADDGDSNRKTKLFPDGDRSCCLEVLSGEQTSSQRTARAEPPFVVSNLSQQYPNGP